MKVSSSMKKNSLLPLTTIQAWIDTHQSGWLEDYFTFLRFPSVSSEPNHWSHVLECHDWLVQYLQSMNFTVESWPTSGHPVIFATNKQAGSDKPTLLIYNHYDVQPVDPLGEWISPPFDPQVRKGEVYARGAQDNKGQCFYVLQALKLLQETLGSFPINIKLCIEGEEEIGSAGLSHLLDQKKKQLKADYLAIVDLALHKANVPCLTLGIRGIVTLDLNVQTAQTDLHSGAHGGIALNPIHVLVKLLAELHDANGRITIPGFYDDVVDVSAADLSNLSLQFDAESYSQQTGAHPLGGEQNYSILERAWTRPTLEINGIYGGYAGKGFKTVIPAKAHAKISCRLVPNQDPKKIGELLKSYFERQTPPGVQLSVDIHPGQGRAVRVSADSTLVKGFAQVFEEVFGQPCEFILEGASIPIVAELAQRCGGETVLLGLGLITDQIHAPNEHFGLDRIKKGISIMARAIQLLA
jgi:acetylornithine deacetylase/succinyl-diaminopimelate desuccinylase-like protein